MISSKFTEWESQFLAAIQSRVVSRDLESDFKNFIKLIIKTNSLPNPYQLETNTFINTFSPQIIDAILEYRSLPKETENHYSSILKYYAQLLGQTLVTAENDTFIQTARKIIENKRSNFYLISPGQIVGQDSETYISCCHSFATVSTLENVTTYLQLPTTSDLHKIETIIKLMFLVGNIFNKTKLNTFVQIAANKVAELIEPLKPRELNETEIDSMFATLVNMTASPEVKNVVWKNHILFSMKIIKSDLLAKQFSSLNTISRICSGSPATIAPILHNENLLDYLLTNGDLHVELVNDFANIFSAMYELNFSNESQLKIFWKKTVSQSQTTIRTFLNALEKIIPVSQKSKSAFFNIIIETNQYPDAILPFLQKVSFQCPSKYKKQIFQVLHDLYFDKDNKSNRPIESQTLLAKTIEVYAAEDDEEFCKIFQDECLDFIKNDKYIEYSLCIMQRTLFKITTEKAHYAFNIIIDKLEEGSVQFLDLLVKVYRKFDSQISDDDFEKIRKVTKQIMVKNSDKVCEFYRDLLDTGVSQNVLDKEKVLLIFQDFCSLPYSENIFGMIKEIYSILNSNQNSHFGIESIWNFLFLTNKNEISTFLMRLYLNSDQKEKAKDFIENCTKNLNCVGSLMAILNLIHFMEDGIDQKVPKNRLIFSTDFCTVSLKDYYNISVPYDICFEGFKRKIASILNVNPSQLYLSENSVIIHQGSFNLSDGMTVSVEIKPSSSPRQDNIINFILPSQVLLEPQYNSLVFEIMLSNDPALSSIALNILNLIPTIPSQLSEVNLETNWDEFLCIDFPYLLIYRMNMIGNISIRNLDLIDIFYRPGMTSLLNLVFNVASSIFPDKKSVNCLLKITKFLLDRKEFQQYREGVFESVKESVPSFLQWVKSVAIAKDDDNLLINMINIMEIFKKFIVSSDEFPEIVKYTIFHKRENVRTLICGIINSIEDLSAKENIIIPLLAHAKNSKCINYFDLLAPISLSTESPLKLWEVVVKSLYDNFSMPQINGSILDVLNFFPPPINYAHSLFKTMNSLVKRIGDDISDTERLFKFLTDEIIFNPYKYYKPTSDIFSVYLTLLEKDPRLGEILAPIVKVIGNFKLSHKNDSFLSATARNRGIKNLGATCYINSTIQQLYNITEFRNQILKADFNSGDWPFEFQYAFAKLLISPSNCIDISNFVKSWRGSDNEIISLHVQQDSVEFLQLLLDRVNQKIPDISSIFSGVIEHKTVGVSVPYECTNYEKFIIFPLDVKNHQNIEDSLQSFLQPDSFECKDDSLGKFEALRYHRVTKAPKILIIQLKRFEYNLTTKEREKLNSMYTFSLNLDFSPVMEKKKIDGNESEAETTTYDLCGVVQHTGCAQSGHYFSDVRREAGKWLCFNDITCKKVNGQNLPTDAAGGTEEITIYDDKLKTSRQQIVDKSTNAYLLFYRMRNSTQNSASLAKSDENNNLVHECPEINPKILEKVLPEIKETILKTVSSTPQFSQIVMKVCENDQNGEFLYKYILNCLRQSKDKKVAEKLIDRCKEICNKNQEFCDFILDQNNDFTEFLVLSKFGAIRHLYESIIEVSLSNCSEKVHIEFYENLLDRLVSQFEIIFEMNNCLSELFLIITKAAEKVADEEILLSSILGFILESIQVYDANHKADNIFTKIDLSNAFVLIIEICKRNIESNKNDEIKEQVASKLFNSSAFSQLTTSHSHANRLIEMLLFLIDGNNEVKNLFIDFLNKNEKNISIPSIALLFNLSLTLIDQNLIDRFFDIVAKKPSAGIALFFDVLQPISHSNTHIFVINSREWIEKFLLSSNISERSAISSYIYKIYGEIKSEDSGDIVIIYQNLIDSVPYLKKVLINMKPAHNNISPENFPTQEYFEMLTWSVNVTGIRDSENIKVFVELLKDFFNILYNKAGFPQLHCLQFLVNVYGEKIFTKTSPLSIINSIDHNALPAINNLLVPILPNHCTEFLRSNLFRRFLANNFGYSQNDASKYIKKTIDFDNAMMIANELWVEKLFRKKCVDRNVSYLKCSWCLLSRYSNTCDVIHSRELNIVLYSFISQNSPVQRPFAKLLAEFNFAYLNTYKDKKLFLFLKTQSLYSKYKEFKFRWNDIFQRVYNNECMISPGAGGLCNFLRSLVALKTKPPKKLLSLISKAPKPLVNTVIPIVPAAMLVCDICIAFPDSGEAINCLLNEFKAINSNFEIVEIFCDAFAKIKRKNFWNDIKLPLKSLILCSNDIRVAGKTVFLMSEQLFDKETLAEFRSRILLLIAAEIRSALRIHSQSNISNKGKRKALKKSAKKLKVGYSFTKGVTNIIKDKMPPLELEESEIDQMTSAFNSFKLEKYSHNLSHYFQLSRQ